MRKYSSEWFLYHFKNNDIARWVSNKTSLYLLVMTKDSCKPFESDLPFRINQWDDLEYFEETESWHNRDVFLRNMKTKKLNGENCVTLVLDNQLVFMNFFGLNSKESVFSDVGIKILYPPCTTTQYSAYVHPKHRGKGLYVIGKKFVSNYLFENTETKFYVGAVRCENRLAHKGQLASGLHSVARIEKTCFLGSVVNSVAELHPNYKLRVVEHEPSSWRLELIE